MYNCLVSKVELERELFYTRWDRRIGQYFVYNGLMAQARMGDISAISSVPLTALRMVPEFASAALILGGVYFAVAGRYCANQVKEPLNEIKKHERELVEKIESIIEKEPSEVASASESFFPLPILRSLRDPFRLQRPVSRPSSQEP